MQCALHHQSSFSRSLTHSTLPCLQFPFSSSCTTSPLKPSFPLLGSISDSNSKLGSLIMVHAMEEEEYKCDGCEGNCRTCQEEIYWTHFRNLQFFVVLGKDFLKQLVLPRKFARNVSTKIPSRVFLKGPTGAKWEVILKVNSGEMCFLEGWEEFAKDICLQQNDILHFVYSRGSSFDVRVFSGKDLCERESCYFIVNCGHKKSEKKRDIGHITSDTDYSESIPVKRTRKDPVGEIVENLNGSRRTLSKEHENNGGKDPIGDLRPRNDTGVDAAEKSANQLCSRGAASKEHVKNGGKIPLEDNLRPTKTSRGGAAENPGILASRNPKKSPPTKAIGKPRSLVQPNSSGKANIFRDEIRKAATLRKSASTPRKKPGVTGQTSGRSIPQQVSRPPIGPRKPAPMNSSVELTAGSGEDMPSSENEESVQLLASSTEQSAEDEEYTGRTVKKSPKYRSTQKNGAHQKAALSKEVQPCSSTKPTAQSAMPNSAVLRNECCKSNRRHVKEVEKEAALQLASKEQTDESFIKVMLARHVYRHFHMSIPAEWIENHMTTEDQDVTLRVGEEAWSVRFNYCSKEQDAVLGSGWKNFVLDNFLEESDVCLFKLASQKGEAIILDVRIFRVVQEVTPPTMVAVS